MTEKLYYTNSHLKSFESLVTSCTKVKEGLYECIFESTAFFPEGGGQSSDTGYLVYNGEKLPLLGLIDRNDDVIHLTNTELHVGNKIEGFIDYDLRFKRMQNHSGEHILSGIAHRLYGCNNVGFHMGHNEVTLDFDIELNFEQIQELERLANRAVYENLPFTSIFPSEEELKTLDYRSKKELSGKVRLVDVSGYDLCACCAPHVKLSGEIGIIKIFSFTRYKGGIRLFILCGSDALERINLLEGQCTEISELLSAKQSELAKAVHELDSRLKKTERKLSELRHAHADMLTENLESGRNNIVIFDDILDAESRRAVANAGAELCKGVCAVFFNSANGYGYVMASKNTDLKAKAAEINKALSGKGGGSATMISGSVNTSKNEIKTYFGE